MSEREIRFCPYCGTSIIHENIYGENRPTCPDCHWVHYSDPKVAAASLVIKDQQVLLVQRIYEPDEGCWSLPAGFVNAYEDAAHAAERECFEETGIKIQAVELIKVYTGREHKNGADIVLVYRGIFSGGKICAGDDASQAAFFPLDKLPPLAFRSTIELLNL